MLIWFSSQTNLFFLFISTTGNTKFLKVKLSKYLVYKYLKLTQQKSQPSWMNQNWTTLEYILWLSYLYV